MQAAMSSEAASACTPFVWPQDEFGPYPKRGLIVSPKYTKRFVAEAAADRKTMEVRNHRCRCLQPMENFLLIESGVGKNTHGVTLMKAIAILGFEDNMPFGMDDYNVYQDLHALTEGEYSELKNGWLAKRPENKTVYGWKVYLVRALSKPLYFQWKNQDCSGWPVFDLNIGLKF